MKRLSKVFAVVLAILLIAVNLTACGKTKFTVEEAGKGVVRVMLYYSYDEYRINDDYSLEYNSTGYTWGKLGSAWGVGEVGKETKYFVTNSHVTTDNLTGESIAVMRPDGNYYMWVFTNLVGYYILLDDYAYDPSSENFDLSRAVPCNVIYQVNTSQKPDIAVLEAIELVKGRIALGYAESTNEARPGNTVYTIGYPGVADISSDTYLYGAVDSQTIRSGAVSQHTTMPSAQANARVIQHDAKIDSGNSGGALINEDGLVVGINTWSYSDGDGPLYYSVETDYLTDILNGLHIQSNVYPFNFTIIIIIAAAVVAIAVIVVLIVVLAGKGKNKNKNTAKEGIEPPPPLPPLANGDTGYRVQGVAGVHSGRRYAIMNGKPMIFGRGAGSVIKYPDGTPGVSGTHCTIWAEGGRVFLKDNGSTHGTFLGQNKIAPNQTVQLNVGDTVCLGSPKEKFVIASKGGV